MMLIYMTLLDTEEERQLFQKIYEENYKKMYSAARRIVNSHEKAEDAVQEAFLKLATHFNRYSHLAENKMEALCITIVKHAAVDLLRKEKNLTEEQLEEIRVYGQEECDRIEEIVVQKELSRNVARILETLPEVLKITLQLKYYQGYSNREIAKTLGISEKTVEMRLYRGRKKVEDLLMWGGQENTTIG